MAAHGRVRAVASGARPLVGGCRKIGSSGNLGTAASPLNILDRFHVVAKMNLAIDEVRAAEARRLAAEDHEPVLKKSKWCLLKRPALR
ncbi:MAG: transposase [Gammaproteobacteria bacterium]|jgi:hypothetical protein|nr:transposase [Gammaproteobacteria bacterium]